MLKRGLVLSLGIVILAMLPFLALHYTQNYTYMIILGLLEMIIVVIFSIIGICITFKNINIDSTLKGATCAAILYIGHIIGNIIIVNHPDYKIIVEKISNQLGSDVQIVSPLAISSLVTSFLIFLLLGSFAGWIVRKKGGMQDV
ncbi:MAG TPA: hypothetical protein DCE04_03635 [Thermoanaerobacter sp.]|nr:MAG: hypothetical protein XD37_1709 [Thermoanaerobacter thermocopriae]HAA64311.1 hypothetical protein [Thermoanaerobacter sp.]HAA80884.1 hypothetical protein [Thermoanaerobacter sp.]